MPVVVRDSAGVRIVEHGSLAAPLPPWTLSEPPEATIGGEGRGAAHQLSTVVGAVRLSDGRIVVADGLSREARYFDVGGEALQTVGGQGEGPGELRFLYSIDLIPGDTVVLGGWPIGYRYWFDEDGVFVNRPMLGPWFPGLLGRTLDDGSLLLDSYPSGSHGNEVETWVAQGEAPYFRPVGVIERVTRDGTVHDTLIPFESREYFKRGVWRDDLAVHAMPFSPVTLVSWRERELHVANTGTAEVRTLSFDGEVRRVVRWSAEPSPVTAADRQTFRKAVMDRLRQPQRQTPSYERWLAEVDFPEAKTVFDTLVADRIGNLWVKESVSADAPRNRWIVFGPDGIAVAEVDIPGGLRIVHADRSHVLGVAVDDLDVPTVRSYRIVR
jgi:hypothetical protein